VQKVVIPTADGQAIAYTLDQEVDAWRDPETGETYLDGHAIEELDRVKARHMGLLAPGELRALRRSLGLTQRGLSALLQIGARSWTRWETGRERPSRSMNVLLRALKDGRVDAGYLRTLQPGAEPCCDVLTVDFTSFVAPTCYGGTPASHRDAHEAETRAS
jgi:DNA-binding transcriptional regulator YiaG